MARWISSAATVESTPPLRPQTTRAVADLRPDPRGRLLDERRHRPVARAAADVEREVPEDLETAIRVRRLRDGTAGRTAPRAVSSIAATGALALVATTAKPWRRGLDVVAVARPDAQVVRQIR